MAKPEPPQPELNETPLVIPQIAGSEESKSAVKEEERESDAPPKPEDEERFFSSERKWTELEGLKQDIKARKRYARCIFRLIVWWLVAIFLLLLLQGFLSGNKIEVLWPPPLNWWKTHIGFRLADSVLLALIGGTTANVLGIFVLVVRYLFPGKSN